MDSDLQNEERGQRKQEEETERQWSSEMEKEKE